VHVAEERVIVPGPKKRALASSTGGMLSGLINGDLAKSFGFSTSSTLGASVASDVR
jgi:hypothetical protein